VRYRERSLWRALTLITVTVLLVPGVSYDYRLVFLLIPFSFFLRSAQPDRLTACIACVFGLLFAPKYYGYDGDWIATPGGILTPPAILLLGALTTRHAVRERRRSRSPAETTRQQPRRAVPSLPSDSR